ncbi:hypothetical protein EZV61_15595 [Corallincola luteus]|uniref:H-type lectin domain-containing protein n=1 Tax=Corallincola luteus TaxID=1775177 RepID=A0ABY2AJT1_9GAMM|nr:H-type lectin domain-containing protein [Corallincola luteus]TCI02000.1 hypothetical protein EZV61_15595 [Corallincola luteus]
MATTSHHGLGALAILLASLPAWSNPSGDYNGWYQSNSGSGITAVDDGMRWSPVKKPTTVHRYLPAQPLIPGETLQFSMMWRSDGYSESNKDFDCSDSDPTDQGEGISDRYLRCLAGTGDFRIGFFDSGGVSVGNDSCEGNDEKSNCDYEGRDEEDYTYDFNHYRGFQVRIHPHLSEGFDSVSGRLREDHGGGKMESHINLNLWSRINPGENGLMSDECQAVDHCGFSKGDDWGTQPQSWGPNMPFGEARLLQFDVKMLDTENFEVWVTMNGARGPLLTGSFPQDFRPDQIDTLAITYTNSSRRYDYVELTQLQINGVPVDDVRPEEPGGPEQQPLLSELRADSGRSYRLMPALSEGSKVYSDRSYHFIDVGGWGGQPFIQTANDDDQRSDDYFLRFTLNQPALIGVLYDIRASELPEWLSDWQSTGEIVKGSDTDFKVYRKRFDAGDVVLGGNQGDRTGARSMYSVVFKPVYETHLIDWLSANSDGDYYVGPALVNGSRIYSDRSYTFTDVGNLAGLTSIVTANDDSDAVGDEFLEVGLLQPTRLYLLFDVRASDLPEWMKGWKQTETVVTTTDTSFNVFTRQFDAGTVVLGANQSQDTGARSMYLLAAEPAIPAAMGQLTVAQSDAHQWHSVRFDQAFAAPPVVVMGPPSYAGPNPLTVRVRDVTTEGFEFQLDEWNYQDGVHAEETLSYLAVAAGDHQWGGIQLHASLLNTVNHQWQEYRYTNSFSTTPVVLAQQVTDFGAQATVVRMRTSTADGFELRLQEEEANDDNHALEQLNVIALSPGEASMIGMRVVAGLTDATMNHRWQPLTVAPVQSALLFATIQTTLGGDPVALRHKQADGEWRLKVEEERSKDDEIRHVAEQVGWLTVTQE